MVRFVFSLSDWLDRAATAGMVLALAAGTAVAFVEVVYRYVLTRSFPWSTEFVVFTFVWATFLGVAVAYRARGHMAVEAFVDWLPALWRRVVRLLAELVTLGFFAVLCWKGWELAAFAFETTSPDMRIRMTYFYGAIPVSAGMILVHGLRLLIGELGISGRAAPSPDRPERIEAPAGGSEGARG